ncbi:Nuclear factor NF-kappa-B p105 subunit [Vermiconidia calcicola]|uniref:Nuclear factor NF-kappa-B p105 subunit n=1 Tax=Vermiconidia calcicola TaxID=1690605 RepID=A0ACC3MNY0_9PEZI|nr:Nuclear factor NF-kappa-B p105 subunit [Vermiconidia calcicola]
MTKDWTDIESEACELYTAGRTLKQMQGHFYSRSNFKASKWNLSISGNAGSGPITLAAEAGCARSPEPAAVSTTCTLPDSDDDDCCEITDIGTVKPLEHIKDDVSNEALHDWYQWLDDSRFRYDAQTHLKQASFNPHERNILHYAARREGSSSVLETVISYMLSQELDLDTPDPWDRTALELAVRSDRSANVEILLRADAGLALTNHRKEQLLHMAVTAGASVSTCKALMTRANPHTRNAKGKTPLELAIAANNTLMVDALLDAGALVSASRFECEQALCLAIKSKASLKTCSALMAAERHTDSISATGYDQERHTALDVVITSLQSCSDDRPKVRLYALHDQLLQRSTSLDPNNDVDKLRFTVYLDSLAGIPPSDTPTTQAAERCLKTFLRKEFSPFERYDRSGPGSVPVSCSSLVMYSLLHASSSEAMGGIVEYCDAAKFGQELFYLLVNACKNSYWPADAPPVTTFLQALLNRDVHFDSNKNPLSLILRDFPNSTQKGEILRSLMKWGKCNLLDRSAAYGHPLHQLTQVPEPLRWDLAEILLSHDAGLDLEARGHLDQVNDCVFIFHPIRRCQDYTSPAFRAYLSRYTDTPYTLQQCVVHVLSKTMIEKRQDRPRHENVDQLRKGLRLRRDMCLPGMLYQ